MKVISSNEESVIVEMSRWELSLITGLRIRRCREYGEQPGEVKVKNIIGKEISVDKLAESIKTASAVKYNSKRAIESLDEAKEALQKALFPFFDTYEKGTP